MLTARDFFSEQQQDDIKQAIMDAELDTSGEIRVHIETECKGEVLNRALTIFKMLKMQDTRQRNGVLFYLAVRNRKFAVLGDQGIHTQVGDDFWDSIRQHMVNHFRQDEFTMGLCDGIRKAGEQLKKYFPYQRADQNELSDEVSFDD